MLGERRSRAGWCADLSEAFKNPDVEETEAATEREQKEEKGRLPENRPCTGKEPGRMKSSDLFFASGESRDFSSVLREVQGYLSKEYSGLVTAGATSSGKTTLLGWLLTTIPDNKRIYSIENGSRELALVRRKEGRVVNSVIHTLTRDSENERQRIDQTALLDMALRFNPDIIVVGEMRGPEANAAQEAARTGVAVVTTIHSMSCDATYRRMVSLCKRAVEMRDETLMGFVTEAYPIVAFCKQLENK